MIVLGGADPLVRSRPPGRLSVKGIDLKRAKTRRTRTPHR